MESTTTNSVLRAACEIVGPGDAPVIAALGGISATRHVCASVTDPSPGWWELVAGPGRALDTRRYRVLGLEYLDGGRDAGGRPARTVTTHDQADALAAALDDAGIPRLRALVGASYGGMVALAFAERHPDRVQRLVVVGAAHRSHAMTTALRTIQRRVVELGLETGRPGDALAIARGLAVTTYRTASEFSRRFTPPEGLEQVDAFLRAHGERFTARFTPERFLALSLSADLHRVAPERIGTPATLVAIEDDAVVPRAEVIELAARLGGPSRLVDLPSPKGHDGFLTEHHALSAILSTALTIRIPS